MEPKDLQLPVLVVSPSDLGRLERELEVLDESLLQTGIRSPAEAKLPATSQLMTELAQLNQLNLLKPDDRQQLRAALASLRTQAPRLHVSFSADPSPAFMEKLVAWLRREINPQTLVTVGLQPNIGAGCVVRSTNKVFDCSLRQDFAEKRGLLLEKIIETATQKVAA